MGERTCLLFALVSAFLVGRPALAEDTCNEDRSRCCARWVVTVTRGGMMWGAWMADSFKALQISLAVAHSIDTTGCNHFKDLKQCSNQYHPPVCAPSTAKGSRRAKDDKDRQTIVRMVLDEMANPSPPGDSAAFILGGSVRALLRETKALVLLSKGLDRSGDPDRIDRIQAITLSYAKVSAGAADIATDFLGGLPKGLTCSTFATLGASDDELRVLYATSHLHMLTNDVRALRDAIAREAAAEALHARPGAEPR